MVKDKNYVLIENSEQAIAFLERRGNLNELIPVCFDYGSLSVLENSGIKFIDGEDYENEKYHANVKKIVEKIIFKMENSLNVDYKGVKLIPLYRVLIYQFLVKQYSYFDILKRFDRKENIKKIYYFDNGSVENVFSGFISEMLGEKVEKIYYNSPKNKSQLLLSIGGWIQNAIGKTKLNIVRKGYRKIFLAAPKTLFESTLREILSNKQIKVWRCSDNLLKGFFVNGNYIPFYQFGKASKSLGYNFPDGVKEFDDDKYLIDLGVSKELVPSFRKFLKDSIVSKFENSALLIEEVETLSKEKKIDLVLLHQDVDLFQKTLVFAAKRVGIPTVVLQHGICGLALGYVPVSSDYFFCWGKGSKKRLTGWGVSPEKIVEIGAPQFDDHSNTKDVHKNVLYAVTTSTCSKKLPGTLSRKRQEEILRILIRTMKKFPEHKLIVKIKKGWDLTGMPEKLAKEENYNGLIVKNQQGISDFINNSFVVVISTSAAGVEAIILKRHLISYDFKDLEKTSIYYGTKAAKVVFNEGQLEESIRKSLNWTDEDSKARMEFLDNQFYKADGKSNKRAAKFIENILEGSNGKNIDNWG